MRLGTKGLSHLTYCTHVHPGNGWDEVFANIRRYAPGLKKRLSPNAPFGLGLRLSSRESETLLSKENLNHFKRFLDDEGLYVFTLNGFPFGPFHGLPVKANVFAPDWRHPARVNYTIRLIKILKGLIPEGGEGGISTAPLSYKRWISIGDLSARHCITRNLVKIAEVLISVKQGEGKILHLDIEPEPDGLIENSAEIVDFYQTWLLPVGGPLLAKSMNVSVDQAQQSLLEHIQVCFDTCHMAVEYEDPKIFLERLSRIGIQIGKVQISSALKVALPDHESRRADLAKQLEPFAEPIYLHQVMEWREGGELHHYRDLDDALMKIQEPTAKQWRIHFHLPLFVHDYGSFLSTQDHTRAALELLQARSFSRHLEIETYTWAVLPPALKQDLTDSIEREYRWVLQCLERPSVSVSAF